VSIGWFQEAVGEAQTGPSDFLAFFWGVGESGSAFSFPHVSLVSYKKMYIFKIFFKQKSKNIN